MQKTFKIFILCFIIFMLFSSICFATDNSLTLVDPGNSQEGNNQDSVTIFNTDLYLYNTDVTIDKPVNGNVFVYGNTVTIKEQIEGDLFVLAQNLVVEETASISNNIFAYANQIVVKGSVNDIYAFGQNFVLESTGTITRDVKLYCSQVTLKGNIQKDAYIAAGLINFEENAQNVISGNLHYSASNQMQIPEGAVSGEIKFTQINNTLSTEQIISSYISSFVNMLFYSLVVVLLFTFFSTKWISKTTYCLTKRPFITAGIGILSFVLVPVIALVLLISGFLSYVGIALLAVYILAISITISILGMAIGNYFVSKLKNKSKTKSILLSLASVTVLWILQQIPVIGGYLSLFTYVVGFGIFVFAFFTKKEVSL